MADQAIEVPVVVGSNSAQALLCTTIVLPTPALEIKDIRKTVIVDRCTVVPNKIIIDGRLRKDINFKTLATGTAPPAPGNVNACGGIVNQASGAVEHTTVDIAFNLFIPITGALPGDICAVLQAFVEGEVEEPLAVNPATGTFAQIIDKSIVFICAKVTRSQVLAITGATPVTTVCPPGITAGTPVTGVTTVSVGTTPGPLPGTFVGPVVTFPGPTTEGLPGFVPPATAGTPGTAVTFTEEEIASTSSSPTGTGG